MATATTSVKKAFDTQDDLKSRREHCAVAARTLASLDRVRGQQVRVHHDAEFALYTVSELLHETTASVVRMGLPGRQRLRPDPEPDGVRRQPRHKVADPDLSRRRTPDRRRARRAVGRRRLADAPHRHRAPRRRHRAAHRRTGRAGGRPPRLAAGERLAMQGLGPNGGAFVRWHITSTDIDPTSFPLLATVASRRFARAVAFHGFDDEPGVLIGGTAPDAVKERVRDAIARVLPTGLDVRIAGRDERYAGDDPNNIVNRLSPVRRHPDRTRVESPRRSRHRHRRRRGRRAPPAFTA